MKDAHVTLTLEKTGAVVKVSGKVVSNTDATKSYERTVTLTTDEADVFLNLTVDNCYLKVKSVTSSDNSGTSDKRAL